MKKNNSTLLFAAASMSALVLAGCGALPTGGNLIWIIHNSSEGGYR